MYVTHLEIAFYFQVFAFIIGSKVDLNVKKKPLGERRQRLPSKSSSIEPQKLSPPLRQVDDWKASSVIPDQQTNEKHKTNSSNLVEVSHEETRSSFFGPLFHYFNGSFSCFFSFYPLFAQPDDGSVNYLVILTPKIKTSITLAFQSEELNSPTSTLCLCDFPHSSLPFSLSPILGPSFYPHTLFSSSSSLQKCVSKSYSLSPWLPSPSLLKNTSQLKDKSSPVTSSVLSNVELK